MTSEEMMVLLEKYQTSCDMLTLRINQINLELRGYDLSVIRYNDLKKRLIVLREERRDLVKTMCSMQGYVR